MYLPRVSKTLKITIGMSEFQVPLSSLSKFLRKEKVGTFVTPGNMMKVIKKTMKTCEAWLKTCLYTNKKLCGVCGTSSGSSAFELSSSIVRPSTTEVSDLLIS